ncbi:MAG: DegT/DnrJ/EryC1/StrS family aminotransferase [Acidobacteria bacterium]|nr:DegT/DnrJ/EryC1/StrS family aminotransferase [Acidobacteriota bacterium]
MLESIITSQRAKAAGAILEHYRGNYLPHAVIVPSARFGLYALAKELLRPGERVAVSPITCHSVIEALLAAAVVPVFTDIELETGNIDVARLAPLLQSVRAVVTTNLYGNPDRAVEIKPMAAQHGVLVIEDCAHVLRTSLAGRRIGTVGDASVFSFKKFFGEGGGVVTTRDGDLAERIERRVSELSHPPACGQDALRLVQHTLLHTMPVSARWASVTYRRVFGTRSTARAKFDAHQEQPTTASLRRTADCVAQEDAAVEKRARRIRALRESCSLPFKSSPHADEVCYFAAPFFCSRRDQAIQTLKECGVDTYFLYPPLNRAFPDLARTSFLNLDLIHEWSRNILPVHPDCADEFAAAARTGLPFE